MKKCFLSLVCALLLIPSVSFADNNMRDYIPAPPGTMLNLVYYMHISGDTLNVDGDKAADVDFNEDLWLLREVYYFKLGSFLTNAQIIVPFGRATLDVGGGDQKSAGLGDIMLLSTIWLLNQPENDMYLAFSPYVFLPTGQYDNEQSLNLGGNWWTFRGEVNFTKGFEVIPDHKAYFEVTTGCDLFTTNNDYFGEDLNKDPLFNLEGHVSYDLTKTLAASVDYYGHFGGELKFDGDRVDDSDTVSHTLGGTLTWGFAPGWQGLLQYRHDLYNKNGIEAQVIQARIFYAFDLGGML